MNNIQCKYCLKYFAYPRSLKRHQLHCNHTIKPIIKKKEEEIRPVDKFIINQLNEINKKVDEIRDSKQQMLLPTDAYNKVILPNADAHTKIIIKQKLPTDFYAAIIEKLGKNNALLSINKATANRSALDLYKMLFPSNKIEDNPIIYHNNMYQYLDSNSNEIISTESKDIIRQIARDIQTAMLMASNDLIKQSIKENITNQLYDVYDIASIQENVCGFKEIEEQLINYIESGFSEN